MSGDDLISEGYKKDSRKMYILPSVDYVVEINEEKERIKIITLWERELKNAQSTAEGIIDWGVVSWYNYGGRLGMWFKIMDGPESIQYVQNIFVEEEDFDMASKMKEAYNTLKEYMIEEEIWGVDRAVQ